MKSNDWLHGFRHSSPYINAHRGRTVVLTLGGEALAHENLINIIHDITLLSSLGVKLVVAFGARPQIQQRFDQAGLDAHFHEGLRVTPEDQLPLVIEAVGALRAHLESRLSMGLINSPMHGARIRVSSGNLVAARPEGVLNGVDFGYTGRVRRVDVEGIESLLKMNHIVLLPPLGYSPTGDVFNLSYEDVGSQVASALKAEKLIIFTGEDGVLDEDGQLIREMTVRQARDRLADAPLESHAADLLRAACEACVRGVRRSQIISYMRDGALLEELFTRDGSGTLVSDDNYEQIRGARVEDIGGILELIQPLEEQGILVRRSRELLETEVDRFTVVERDGTIVGCAALYEYPSEKSGELSCFAVDPSYRRAGRGDEILAMVERLARGRGLENLFVLTTQTEHWFRERGFEPSTVQSLPGPKLASYNTQRNSKVFVKRLA
ncbi:amino-acid N-acetyltransferase [Marinobacter nanhaiticus D15-8W]|uniref:Amino-acid acetyltransferase n=1 Tax=Marinobacter nanhaiticus D15-8W TaxID=626887 RepID=N6WX89_9GAMM|nr:amino-acid N-acetyltransferase [Marinobacter nanhaiticus]ENO15672.1 amino-acid N-acetyltransferase [Marinobacter nanhaiticus D15-8W]BES73477.1 amino-acid N-acetyltransferase [Marinobacter nanhaiticus D15-8W]